MVTVNPQDERSGEGGPIGPRRKTGIALAMGAAIAGLMLGATIAVANGFGMDGTFRGCVNERTGDLRLIADSQDCRTYETDVAWTSGDAVVAVRWYLDGDGDGYGDWYASVDSPGRPDGYVANNDDCDDTSADAYPGRADDPGGPTDSPFEFAAGDWDCDGVAGEDRQVEWYVDRDGDGYGSGTPIQAPRSDPPAGMSRAFGDCDDADAGIGPYSPACGSATDFDADGHHAHHLGGDDCDDFAVNVYPGNAELDDGFGVDEDCDPLSGAVPTYDPFFIDPRSHDTETPLPQVD